MNSFNNRFFICPNCGKELNWYEDHEECNYEPDNNGQY